MAGAETSQETIRQLTEHITAFFRALEHQRSRNAESVGLTPTDYRAMARVAELSPMTPKKLAELMGMSTGAITAVTDHLVDRGLLERHTNAADRRSVMLQPTAEGRELIEGLFGPYRDLVADVVKDSSPQHIDELMSTLGRLTERLSQAG